MWDPELRWIGKPSRRGKPPLRRWKVKHGYRDKQWRKFLLNISLFLLCAKRERMGCGGSGLELMGDWKYKKDCEGNGGENLTRDIYCDC